MKNASITELTTLVNDCVKERYNCQRVGQMLKEYFDSLNRNHSKYNQDNVDAKRCEHVKIERTIASIEKNILKYKSKIKDTETQLKDLGTDVSTHTASNLIQKAQDLYLGLKNQMKKIERDKQTLKGLNDQLSARQKHAENAWPLYKGRLIGKKKE